MSEFEGRDVMGKGEMVGEKETVGKRNTVGEREDGKKRRGLVRC